ncbi:MAG: segregation/condensation protein A [Oscillospiraceae bacterium]|nr:segregation/condensation protein A [Oscillospiraceae bacterium]MDD4546553.1 segregation/condensation protein A [Oscillospiraceae bacterium]
METISYKIPGFEGPLDLLLHLVQKHKLNITDIPIAELLEQYMKTIEEWKNVNLDVAAEFLEMAARLVFIKTAMLLPRHEEADEMRRELSGELMEYRHCQEAARRLAVQNISDNLFVRGPADIEPDLTYRRLHPKDTMLDAYLAAAGRGKRRLPPPAKAFNNIVSHKIVSVSSKIIFVLRRLYKNKKINYSELFEQADSRSELVAIFLALLELMKANRIHVDGDGDNQLVSMKSRKGKSNIKA